MAERVKLKETLPTDLSSVNPFVERVIHRLCALTDDPADIFNIKLALEEALTNAMRHGNAMDASKDVAVCISADRRSVTIDVHDQGSGFDFRVLPDPTASVRPSGRGVYLMRQIMDKVEFYDKGSGVKMKKLFSPAR